MSRGLGKVERRILEGLQATERPYAALYELMVLVEGRIQTLDDPWQHWNWPVCEPHPKIKLAIGLIVDHAGRCYPPRPSDSVREATSRAVRSLVRKGLVRCEYSGGRPKRLVVCLPATDPTKLPKGHCWENAVKAHLLWGNPLPVTRIYERSYWPRRRKRHK